jgi:hypothetical protein
VLEKAVGKSALAISPCVAQYAEKSGATTMMVTFRTKSWNSVTMFGDVALQLIKMMGHSGTIPSAMLAADIPQAIERLQGALAKAPDVATTPATQARKPDDDEPPPVNLRQRAFPLIELLSAAARQKSDVTWEKGAPAV